MSDNTVKDRSGGGSQPARKLAGDAMPSKAERRALGKAAARKRAVQRRRRELRTRILQIAAPFVAVGVIIGAIFLFGGNGDDDTANNTATPTDSAGALPSDAATPWTLPAGLDPQLGTKPAITAGEGTLDSLKVTTLVTGAGPALQVGDTVQANYVLASYPTGEELQSSWTDDTNATPFTFQLGGAVIDGWNQGLVGVTVGSRVQLDVPEALAYAGQEGYPAGDLRFIVDILGTTAAQ